MRLSKLLLIIACTIATNQAVARERTVFAISPALSLGIGGFRAGAAAEVGFLKCVDACTGFGLSVGASDFARQEYMVGGGLIMLYLGSLLLHADVRIRDGKVSGFHFTPGWGVLSLFGILRLGYDTERKQIVAEIGITGKIPLSGW